MIRAVFSDLDRRNIAPHGAPATAGTAAHRSTSRNGVRTRFFGMSSRHAFGVAVALTVATTGCSNGCSKSDGRAPEGTDAAIARDAGLARTAPSGPANGLPVASASVAAFVNPQNLPAYSGPVGSIEGTISITGEPSPDAIEHNFGGCPEAATTYGKLFRAPPLPGDATTEAGVADREQLAKTPRPVADVVIAVTGYSGFYVPEKNDEKRIVIRDCAFPRVTTMTMGQRLTIANETKDAWAPALPQAPLPALMVAPAGGEIRLYPPHPGHYDLVDRLAHGYARSDLWVLMQPLHAVSALDGRYRIDGVPVGKLKVNARLAPMAEDASRDVEILAGIVARVDMTLHYPGPGHDAAAPLRAAPHDAPK